MSIAVVTPSYSGDAVFCAELNRSVLELTPWTHYILADRRDLGHFRRLAGDRTQVLPKEDILPGHLLRVPGSTRWMSPYTVRPLGGWLVQQIAKFACADHLDEDVVLCVDSDVLLVRDMVEADYVRDGRVRLYSDPVGITPDMLRHVEWYNNACRLLGVEPETPPMRDYITCVVSWSRALILSMMDRVAEATGRPWYESVARTPQFSECLLYGVYVDKVLGPEAPVWADVDNHLLQHWGPSPLLDSDAEPFVAQLRADDSAVMICSRSGTSMETRRLLATRLTSGRL